MNTVFENIGRADHRAKLEHSNAINADIISTIHKNFPLAVKQTRLIALQFKGNSREEDAENVWNFLRTKIRYQKDPGDNQYVKLPRRLLSDKTGDCKSYSLFAAAVLHNLGHPVKFRYASYSALKVPTHVYAISESESMDGLGGQELIIDGVYSYFNEEKQPHYQKDYPMKVFTLSGHDNVSYEEIEGIGRHKKTKGGKKGKFKKFAFASARAPFLVLVDLNAHGLATQLAKAVHKDEAAVKNMWSKKLGGSWDKLIASINKGAKKKKLFGIGSVTAVAASVAAAAPVIAIVVKQLKAMGLSDDQIQQVESDTNAELEKQGIDPKEVHAAGDDKSSSSFELSPMMIGAIAVGAFLMFKK